MGGGAGVVEGGSVLVLVPIQTTNIIMEKSPFVGRLHRPWYDLLMLYFLFPDGGYNCHPIVLVLGGGGGIKYGIDK